VRDGKEQLVLVVINEKFDPQTCNFSGDFSAYKTMEVYETSTQRDLARVKQGQVETSLTIPAQSVVTIVMSK